MSRRTRIMVVATTVALSLLVWAPMADARWRVHNDADVTEITAPKGGSQRQTCSDRLKGRSGWSALVPAGQDPKTYGPIPSIAFAAVKYWLWKTPPGITSFAGVQELDSDGDGNPEGFFFVDDAGNELPATLVRQFSTPARTRLDRPKPVFPPVDPSTDNLYVLTATRFSVSLRQGTVRPGDHLGLLPRSGGSTFIDLTAIDCDD